MTNPIGATFERKMADYLAAALDNPDIDRQVKCGSKDRGDIRGVRAAGGVGGRVAIECKNVANLNMTAALREAEVERVNLEAVAGVVISKRRGKGKPGDQLVTMTVDDFVALIWGTRRP